MTFSRRSFSALLLTQPNAVNLELVYQTGATNSSLIAASLARGELTAWSRRAARATTPWELAVGGQFGCAARARDPAGVYVGVKAQARLRARLGRHPQDDDDDDRHRRHHHHHHHHQWRPPRQPSSVTLPRGKKGLRKINNMLKIVALMLLSFVASATATDISIYSQQVFIIPIVPRYFNWTSDDGRNEYRYEASLLGSPDLPPWIHYTYSKRTHRGYLYGVPPKSQKIFKLEIIALNKKTYETRDKVLEVTVSENDSVSKYQIQLKVNNWNVEDMFDQNRTETLFEQLRNNVWKNATDLQLTFLAPAVELGARYPLKPGEGVGTVLRLGSSTPFSNELQNLEKELEPIIKKFTTCEFKKVSFDRYFPGFDFDWCYFRLIEDSNGLQQESARRDVSASIIGGAAGDKQRSQQWHWSQPRKAQVPGRSYRREIFTSLLVPALLLLVLVAFLSAALCLHHDEFISSNGKRGSPLLMDNGGTNGVQMIQYATTSSSRGTLRSLSATQPSCSPTLSDSQLISRSPRVIKDHSNMYVRPNPPPYMSPNNFGGIRADF